MSARPRGFTLVELVVLIVVVSVTLVGVLLTYQTVVRSSADPQVRKQAQAIAEAMLDEVLLAAYEGVPSAPWPAVQRSGYYNVADYHNYDTALIGGGIRDIQNNPLG